MSNELLAPPLGSIPDHGHLKPEEISRDEYFMDICRVLGEKATCDRGKSGCVITKNNVIIATAFVDAPYGSPTCDEVGHQMTTFIHEDGHHTEHCMRNVCAEQGAIANATKSGISLEGATLYSTMTPCSVRHCAHLIVACGIRKVVCDKKYHDAAESEAIFQRAGIALVYLHQEVEQY
ncbi:MAG: cell division protein DedD [Candidatus Peribacteria bacterium]|nr:cell division protein DedD [Candidatus Peribacteria bacterium]